MNQEIPPPTEIAPGIVLSYDRLNRIPNNSVENGAEWPDDWYHSETGAYWVDVPKTGFKSLLLNVSNSTADWRCKAFQVIPNETYTLQAWIKGIAESGEFFLTIRWWRDLAATDFISEDNIPIPLGTYDEWVLFSRDFTTPAEAVSADVMFRCPTPSTGKVYADDFAVLTEPIPQYRITIENQTYPFQVPLNPIETYSHAATYFLEALQFYPLTVRLTVKAVDTAHVEVFDADHERFLLERTKISGEKSFDIAWDGGGVFEPRVTGDIEYIIIDFPIEKPKIVKPIEFGSGIAIWPYQVMAFLGGVATGIGAGYSVKRFRR